MFCRIVAHEAPATIRYEDADVIAFDAEPAATPLHVLVVPRNHIRSVAELADTEPGRSACACVFEDRRRRRRKEFPRGHQLRGAAPGCVSPALARYGWRCDGASGGNRVLAADTEVVILVADGDADKPPDLEGRVKVR